MQTINGIITAILIVIFLGICLWAWSSRNKKNFENMSKVPLEDENKDEVITNEEEKL